MRNFLITSVFVLTLVLGATGAAPVAHAQACLPDGSNAATCIPSGADTAAGGAGIINKQAAADASAASAGEKAAAKIATDNGKTEDDAYNGIMIKIMSLFAWLLGVAAITLDNAVYYTVVTMGKFVNSLSAVGVTWRIMRDIGNIFIIFGFLAIGISIILNTERMGYGKKMLPMLIVAAVFLNFSLFITEAVIDVGNLFATQFYTQINGGNPAGVKSFDAGSLRVSNEGISNKVMNQLGLQTIYGDAAVNKDIFKGGNPWFIGFMGIILFMIAAFVFFSLAFILIARFVILLFLIIIAPIGFAGLAVPQLAGTAKQWWDTLFQQTITAPVLLLLLYVALAVITDEKFLTSFGQTSTWTGFATGNLDGFASMMISFIVAMGLLLAVVILSKKLSAFGAGHASALAGKLTGMSIAAAAPGWVGRHTVGFGARTVAKGLGSTRFGRSFVGRHVVDTLDKKVAGASFDVRNTSLGKASAGVGLNLGKGQTGGYTADLKARTESYERAADRIKGRDQTEEEKRILAATEKKQKEAESEHGTIESSRNKAAQEVEARKAEVARLESGVFYPGKDEELRTARLGLSAGETALADAVKELAKAETNKKAAIAEHDTKKAEIERATSVKAAQEAYAKELGAFADSFSFTKNLKALLGDAAGEAAVRIKANAGKSKEQKALESLAKTVEESAKKAESGAVGGATPPDKGAKH